MITRIVSITSSLVPQRSGCADSLSKRLIRNRTENVELLMAILLSETVLCGLEGSKQNPAQGRGPNNDKTIAKPIALGSPRGVIPTFTDICVACNWLKVNSCFMGYLVVVRGDLQFACNVQMGKASRAVTLNCVFYVAPFWVL